MTSLRLSCREVTRLVLEGEERSLGVGERVVLRLHWLACDGCTRFRRQVETMRGALDKWRQYRDGDGDGDGGDDSDPPSR
jgi:hypothetical protein